VELIGLTSTFGNVTTATATQNIFTLLDLVGLMEGGGGRRPDGQPLPVAAGSPTMLNGQAKVRIADFVHGGDGFGNTHPPPAAGTPVQQSAAAFIAAAARAHPGAVTVLALGPLTNVALAYALGPADIPPALDVVALGGAFFRNGNVNPAAEANALGDPEAADAVLATPGARVSMVGLDVTHACSVSRAAFTAWADAIPGPGRAIADFLTGAVGFYMGYHAASYGMDAMFLHDPTALVAVLAPHLFTWGSGAVVVDTGAGPTRGATVMDAGEKDWGRGGGGVSCRDSGDGAATGVAHAGPPPNAWVGRPRARVATAVDAAKVVDLALTRLREAVVAGGERKIKQQQAA
jgi:uridine nucleosidase